MCARHYDQYRRAGRLDELEQPFGGWRKCEAPGCTELHRGAKYCRPHYVELVANPKPRTDRHVGVQKEPQFDKGFAAYVADRRRRRVPPEGLPTYTLLPLQGQLDIIDAMRQAG